MTQEVAGLQALARWTGSIVAGLVRSEAPQGYGIMTRVDTQKQIDDETDEVLALIQADLRNGDPTDGKFAETALAMLYEFAYDLEEPRIGHEAAAKVVAELKKRIHAELIRRDWRPDAVSQALKIVF